MSNQEFTSQCLIVDGLSGVRSSSMPKGPISVQTPSFQEQCCHISPKTSQKTVYTSAQMVRYEGLLWVQSLNKILNSSLSYHIQYCVIFNHNMLRVYSTGVSIVKINWPLNSLILIMKIPLLVRGHPNILRPRQNGRRSQTTHSNPFSWMKMLYFLFKVHWSLFLRVQITIFQH